MQGAVGSQGAPGKDGNDPRYEELIKKIEQLETELVLLQNK